MNTYCVNSDCPFKDCDKHLSQLKKMGDQNGQVIIADLDSVCRHYMHYILLKLESGKGSVYEDL